MMYFMLSICLATNSIINTKETFLEKIFKPLFINLVCVQIVAVGRAIFVTDSLQKPFYVDWILNKQLI